MAVDDTSPPAERARGLIFYLTLTCVFGGIQSVFCIILPMGTPYMLSLGFGKSVLALVWLGAPVIGALAQPYFGFCSDSSRRRMGKRRPYIIFGACGIIVSLLCLAWVKDIVFLIGQMVLGLSDDVLQPVMLSTAAVFLWSALFFIQPVQAGLRALIVDVCTTEQQDIATAWVSRVSGVGSVSGYALLYTDMSSWLAAEANAQFKAVCVLVSALLAIVVAICCIFIHEKDPREERVEALRTTFWKQIKEILQSIPRLSPQIKAIFKVQLFAWFGWYCFLFYTTTWIGELYMKDQYQARHTKAVKDHLKLLHDAANRWGAFAFLLNAILNLATTVFAPILLSLGGKISNASESEPRPTGIVSSYFETPLARLRAGWIFSQLLFSICMISTFFITSVVSAAVMIAFLGVSAALSMQVIPFTLISRDLSQYQQLQDDEILDSTTRYEHRPGTVMGLHNVAICIPQLFASLCTSFVFWLASGGSAGLSGDALATPDPESTAWVLRSGGLASLLAIYMATKIRDDDDDNDPDKGEYRRLILDTGPLSPEDVPESFLRGRVPRDYAPTPVEEEPEEHVD